MTDVLLENAKAETKKDGGTKPHNALTLRGCVPLQRLKVIQEGNQK